MSVGTSNPVTRVRRFVGLYAWLIREGLGPSKAMVALITAESFVGAFAQGSTIWVLSLLLRAFESDATMELPVFGLTLGRNFASLAIVVAALFALQVVSALCIHAAALQTRALSRAHHERSAIQTLQRFCTASHMSSPDASLLVRQAVVKYPRIMGKAIANMLNLLRVVCLAVAYIFVMFTLSAKISLFILPAFLVLVPFLYRLGARTQQTSQEFYDHAVKNLSRFARRTVDTASRTNLHGEEYEKTLPEQYREDPGVRSYHDAYDHLLLASDRGVLITSLFRPLILCAILLVLGWFALNEAYSWGIILPYVIALLQLMSSVQNIAASLAAFHRFYPRIRRYLEVEETLDAAARPASGRALSGPLRIACAAGPTRSAELSRGDVAVYSSEAALTRLEFGGVIAPLRKASAAPPEIWEEAAFVGRDYVPPPVPLTEILPEDSVHLVPDEEGPARRSTIALLALAVADSEIVFVEDAILEALELETRDALLDTLDGKILFVVASGRRAEVEGAQLYLVAKEGRLAGMGDAEWWRTQEPQRRRKLVRETAGGADGLDDEDEDEL